LPLISYPQTRQDYDTALRRLEQALQGLSFKVVRRVGILLESGEARWDGRLILLRGRPTSLPTDEDSL